MAEPLRDIEISAVSTEGLDQLFQDQVIQVEPKDFQDEIHLEPNEFQDLDQVELVPLAEAAKKLGVSRRYAQKLASSGRIQATQDHKGRWLVKMEHGQIHVIQVELKEFQGEIHLEQGRFQFQDQVIQDYQRQIKELQQKFDVAQEQLKGASFRNGYLESQVESFKNELENQRDTIKLLTDSQHKPSLWARFKNWCLGN